MRRDPAVAEVRAGVTPREKADNPIGKWNRYEITVRKGTVTVVLNGKTVIPTVKIPGLPERGPIGLQHHGAQGWPVDEPASAGGSATSSSRN